MMTHNTVKFVGIIEISFCSASYHYLKTIHQSFWRCIFQNIWKPFKSS